MATAAQLAALERPYRAAIEWPITPETWQRLNDQLRDARERLRVLYQQLPDLQPPGPVIVGTYILYADAVPSSQGDWADTGVDWFLNGIGKDSTIRFPCTGACISVNGGVATALVDLPTDFTPTSAGMSVAGFGSIRSGHQAARQFDAGTEEALISGPALWSSLFPFAYPGSLPSMAALVAGGMGVRAVINASFETFFRHTGFGGSLRIAGGCTFREGGTDVTVQTYLERLRQPSRDADLEWPPNPEQWARLNEQLDDVYSHLSAVYTALPIAAGVEDPPE